MLNKTDPPAVIDRPDTCPAPGEPRHRLHILLAEDISVNQQLAVAILSRQGHRTTVVENGRLVLEAWEKGAFDAILMDVMMPYMDGLEATRLIRQQEQLSGRPRIPIIAMTANAMPGDEARCLEAGMDGYVSKPIRPGLLLEEIDRVLSRLAAPVQARPATTAIGDELPVFDRTDALARIAEDDALLDSLIDMFRGEAPGYLMEIASALDARDMPRTLRAAHTLKGVLATFSARRAEAQARDLEHLAKSGDAAACEALLPAVKAEVDRFLQTLG